jgi:Na+-transporting NADH:ubiquinone oxidoreductase subunit C
MSDRIKSILFAAVLCLVISILLTTASTGLQQFQERNMLIDQHTNILRSVGLLQEDRQYPAEEIERLYRKYIRRIYVDPAGRLLPGAADGEQDLPLYVYQKDGRVESYIVPINSRGLWGRIHGYLALEEDGSTIAGFTVYKHAETPGLGGEIEKEWFQKNWVGKKIVNREGDFVSIGIAKGDVDKLVPPEKQANYVDGISGATLTGKYLSAGIRETLQDYEPVSVRFRRNEVDATPLPEGG